MEEKGVVETKEVADLVLAVVRGVQAVQADGKVDLTDLGQLVALAPYVISAADKIKDVPAELKDLSTPEAAELIGHVMAGLTVDDAKARAIVEKSLVLVAGVWDLIKAVKA